MSQEQHISIEVGGRTLTFSTGKLAKQANGSCFVSYGDTRIITTVCSELEAEEDQDFLPLTVEYREKVYSAGKIPGGFIKREGRPSDREVLACRLTDRPLRPLFPQGYFKDTQIASFVLSADLDNPPDVLSINSASVALLLSDVPFTTPVGAVRIARLDGRFLINPSVTQAAAADLVLVVAGTPSAIAMVEGEAKEVSEDTVLNALQTAHDEIKKICAIQLELMKACGKPKQKVTPPAPDTQLLDAIRAVATEPLNSAVVIPTKLERYDRYNQIKEEVTAKIVAKFPDRDAGKLAKAVGAELEEIKYKIVRENILKRGKRNDGRSLDTVRPITIDLGILPRAHGSALFTRGETQGLVIITLGSLDDAQRSDDIQGEASKNYYLQYVFPPFCVGETGRYGGQGRREVGHGMLAERATKAVVPSETDFPYAMRVVSEILESNGSSSMATVCGTSLALMDAGVKTKSHVAGVAMGLIKEGNDVAILTDILGDEDHLGDMDFKVAGSRNGVTAIQMDIKIEGLSIDLMRTALEKANTARRHILDKMEAAIAAPRPEVSKYAPRVEVITVPKEKIRDIIGPGGKVIRAIVEETGAKIDIEDDGTVRVYSISSEANRAALDAIHARIAEPEINRIYHGKVVRIVDFGAFIEIMPGHEGLLHISEMADTRTERVTDLMNEGDTVQVKLTEIDHLGRVRLSRVAALRDQGLLPPLPEGAEQPRRSSFERDRDSDRGPSRDRGPRGGGYRGDRDRGPRGPRSDRDSRGGSGGGYRGPRSDRGDRGPRPDYADRGPRPERSDRGPRPDYADRGPRPDHADRPARADRPASHDRGEQPPRDREPDHQPSGNF